MVVYSLPGLERPALADLDGDGSTLELAAV